MSLDDYDMDKIKSALLILSIVLFIIIGIILFWSYEAQQPYREVCERNPKERYGQPCTTFDDCVELCTKRLYATAS